MKINNLPKVKICILNAKPMCWRSLNLCFFKYFIYLFLERGEGREKEGNINVWLPLQRPLLGTWPATQACALTRNQTSNPLIHRPALNPLSHTSQGWICFFKKPKIVHWPCTISHPLQSLDLHPDVKHVMYYFYSKIHQQSYKLENWDKWRLETGPQ